MRQLSGLTSFIATAAAQANAANALHAESGTSFQIIAPTTTIVPTKSVAPGFSPALGSQTMSTLLQIQDLNQYEDHGGGGGGGHHGRAQLVKGVELERAGELEAADELKKRRKLSQTSGIKAGQTIDEVDDDGNVLSPDAKQNGEDTVRGHSPD